MKNDFKYKVWNVPRYILGLENKAKSLSENDLEKI